MGLAAAQQLLQLPPLQGDYQTTQGQGLPASPSLLQQVGPQMGLDLVLPFLISRRQQVDWLMQLDRAP